MRFQETDDDVIITQMHPTTQPSFILMLKEIIIIIELHYME